MRTHSVRLAPEQFARPSQWKGFELVDGVPVERSSSVGSSLIAGTLVGLLGSEAKRTGQAKPYAATLGYRCFPHDPSLVRYPRMTLVRRERTAGLHRDRDFMPIVPDLAVEVVAPADTSYGVEERLRDYRLARFPLVWVVHPNVQTVAVYRNGQPRSTVLTADNKITAEPALAHFRCRVAEFFD